MMTQDPTGLPAPDAPARAHSARLAERIRAEMGAAGGLLPFSRFMELALYAPGLGYYSAGAAKLGPGGDFVTAPELSALFSRCLARQCAEVLRRVDGGEILELGAGTGVMAADVLSELQALDALPRRYRILELSAELRHRQRETLARRTPGLLGRVQWLERLPEEPLRGLILANEVMDALPVERFRMSARGPVPLVVGRAGARFVWREAAAQPRLGAFVAALEDELGWHLAPGYESEFNPTLGAWVATLAQVLAAGVVLMVDYGYSRREYYHPQRVNGTLVCHYRHRVHHDPLVLPGLQDISASVDFSAVARAAVDAGLRVAGFTTQAYFLFGCGLASLVDEVDPRDIARHAELSRQVKLLTLPGEMGERFHALALARGLDGPLTGFSFLDRRERL